MKKKNKELIFEDLWEKHCFLNDTTDVMYFEYAMKAFEELYKIAYEQGYKNGVDKFIEENKAKV